MGPGSPSMNGISDWFSYFLPQVVSPMPDPQRLVPSENAEQKKPARQSASPEQVPHSSVEAQDDSAPMSSEAKRARTRIKESLGKDVMLEDSGRTS